MKHPANRANSSAKRLEAYKAAVTKTRQGSCEVHGQNQKFLRKFATHPDHWGRGAGTMLLRWGEAHNVPIAVAASSMAERLYSREGFKEYGRTYVKLEGEDESLDFAFMLWQPKVLTGIREWVAEVAYAQRLSSCARPHGPAVPIHDGSRDDLNSSPATRSPRVDRSLRYLSMIPSPAVVSSTCSHCHEDLFAILTMAIANLTLARGKVSI